ncbi:hypothetical protein ABT186_01755 [Streptomyces sp. NPDC001634]|uniref:hypothetical protein n=1 Tax=Streptomyces sp. NPDC001634 TaxID=3154390 RepID=UPI00332710CE
MNQTDPTAVLARIRQMADYWEQNLPEVIRTPAVVSALRAAMEPATAPATVVSPPTDRAAIIAEVLPDWEAMYEPGNVSDYLIGYANDEHAAKGAAEAWMRSQAEVTGRLEWVPDERLATGRYDRWFELVERHDDGVDTGPGIVVRRRLAVEAHDTGTQQPTERCAHCTHPKSDHDGRADHRAKFSPLVAGEPWCHACNAACDYAPVAQQPAAVAYGDGKGRTYCLRCAHAVGADVPLTANDVDHWELCPSCGRHVVDVARAAEQQAAAADGEAAS